MIQRWLGSTFVRHVSILVGGKTAAALITFIGIPIIARLFEPADFGVAAVFITIAGLAGNVAALNYPRAILLPRSDRGAWLLRSLSFRVLTGLTLLAYAGFVILAMSSLPLPLDDTLGDWLWLLPLAVWLVGAGQILRFSLSRDKAYSALSTADVGQSATNVGGRIGLGLLAGSSVWGLLTSYIGGLLMQLAVLYRKVSLPSGRRSPRTTRRRLHVASYAYRDFPLLNMPSALLANFSSKLPILVLGPWMGPEVVGFYAMAHRLVGMPLELAGNAFRLVMAQKVAEIRNQGGSLLQIYLKAIAGLVVTGLLPFGLLWLFGQTVLQVVLGDKWLEAGRYVEILAPWYFSIWVGAVVPPVMISLRRQAQWLKLQILVLAGRVAAFAACYWAMATVETVLGVFVLVNIGLVIVMLLVGFSQVVASSPRADAVAAK